MFWRIQARDAIIAASGLGEDPELLRWATAIEKKDATFESMGVDVKRWRSFDQKLKSAINKIVPRETSLQRKIMQANEEAVQKNRLLKGRQAMWLVYRQYDVNESLGSLFSLQDLLNVEYTGDHHLQRFRDRWQTVLVGMVDAPNDAVMSEILLAKINDSPGLSHDIGEYHRAEKGTPTRSYDFLMRAIERFVHRKQQEANRKALTDQAAPKRDGSALPAAAGSQARPGTKVCKNFKRGRCNAGTECHFSQVLPAAPSPVPPPAAAPAPFSGGGNGKGRGDGKGKGRKGMSREPRASSLTPAEKKTRPCYAFQRGACTKGDRCEYDHRMFTQDDIQRYGAPRSGASSRGPSPGKGGRSRMPKRDEPCRQWTQSRTCSWGKECAFVHDRPSAPAIVDNPISG
jgi:hypothetical protein